MLAVRCQARPPEMCFEVRTAGGLSLDPFYYRQDYLGLQQWSRTTFSARYARLLGLYEQHKRFAAQLDRNLYQQGFLEALAQQHSRRA